MKGTHVNGIVDVNLATPPGILGFTVLIVTVYFAGSAVKNLLPKWPRRSK